MDRNASKQEINAAFKKLSLKYHPDKNGGDEHYEQLFKEINEAKQVLSNHDTRGEYDEILKKEHLIPQIFKGKEDQFQGKGVQFQRHHRKSVKLSALKWAVAVLILSLSFMLLLIGIERSIFTSEDKQEILMENEIFQILPDSGAATFSDLNIDTTDIGNTAAYDSIIIRKNTE